MSSMCDRRVLASSAFGVCCDKMGLFGPSIGCELLNLIRAEDLGEKDALISDKVPGALVADQNSLPLMYKSSGSTSFLTGLSLVYIEAMGG
ncbi:hypothetical protein N7486_004675 [Penicillium sp. IBT 16267x]|nr:hypothetical protein N7486_004675 [Penicillium sp. IBT 16267x]